jgi:hypothetical protein
MLPPADEQLGSLNQTAANYAPNSGRREGFMCRRDEWTRRPQLKSERRLKPKPLAETQRIYT